MMTIMLMGSSPEAPLPVGFSQTDLFEWVVCQ